MRKWTELARASVFARDEIILYRRKDIYEIRYNDIELMSSACHRSEDIMADKALRLLGRPAKRVLIGGLGLGYTLRAALACLDERAEVVVCEIIPQIAEWHRSHVGHLADYPLEDPRVELRSEDVAVTLAAARGAYDVILLDTDNGPEHLVRTENDGIYHECGLRNVRTALSPAGIAAFWSADRSPDFEARLDALPWSWRCDPVPLPGGRVDALHYVYFIGDTPETTAREVADPGLKAA